MKNKNFKRRLKVHKEGYAILLSLMLLLIVLNIIFYFQSPNQLVFIANLVVSILAFSFFFYFFRSPTREAYIEDENLVIAPADGRVVVIEPTEEYEYFGGERRDRKSVV